MMTIVEKKEFQNHIIAEVDKLALFEINNHDIREKVRDTVLKLCRENERFHDYLVVCDERNNPQEKINKGEFNWDVYHQNEVMGRFWVWNFTITRSGVNLIDSLENT